MGMVISRFDVYMVDLDPTKGSEIKKKRPCVIISPDEMNKYLNTVIAAPLTSVIKGYPSRVNCVFKYKKGEIALDQIRTIDKTRLVNRMGKLNEEISGNILNKLQEIFSW
jgi:mRNA interferase MazF